MKKIILSCLAATVLFGACKKDDNNSSSKSRTELLTSGKWLTTAVSTTITAGGVTSPAQDAFANYDDCEKDDLLIFQTNKNLVSDQGTIKCDPSGPQQSTEGTWNLTNSDGNIELTTGSLTMSQAIRTLDDNNLVTVYTETETLNGLTVTSTTTFTFKKVN